MLFKSEAKKGSGGPKLAAPVGDEGERSVGNRKEHRLRCDYASFPDSGPRAKGVGDEIPQRSHIAKRSKKK